MKANISLREAVQSDYEFLYALHRAALKDCIEQTWGWDGEWQAAYFREHFDLADKRIIQVDGADIGCLAVHDRGDQLILSYIAITPEFQGIGIGSRLIGELLDRAAIEGKPVTLKVLKTNPARALYVRMGFAITEGTPTHYYMVAHPCQAGA